MIGLNDSANDIFVAVFIMYASTDVGIHVFQLVHGFCQCDSVMLHLFGIQQDLVFAGISANDCYLSYSSCGEQAWAYGPVGKRAQIFHGGAVSRQTDNHHLAQYGGLRAENGLANSFGQLVAQYS